MTQKGHMKSSRPYLLRAIYEWLTDHGLTPYLMVDATAPFVRVPERFIEDGKIVLNIEPNAISHLHMGNEAVEFKARFSGVPYDIYLPIHAIAAIYAVENGRGMVFGEEEDDVDGGGDDDNTPSERHPMTSKGSKKPHLRIVK